MELINTTSVSYQDYTISCEHLLVGKLVARMTQVILKLTRSDKMNKYTVLILVNSRQSISPTSLRISLRAVLIVSFIHLGKSKSIMSKSKYDHNEVIAEEVLKRRDILLDNANLRLPNLNSRRRSAWKEIRMVVFTKCEKDMSIEQIKRSWRTKKANIRDLLNKEKTYRTGTGGGIDLDLEKAINKGLSLMSETDVQIARSFGKEASFSGLRVAESAVCASEPASSQLPRESIEKDRTDELMHQLSTFDSESDRSEYNLSPPPKRSRSKQEHFLEEQKELMQFQRLVLEKQYALCTKLDTLLDKISLKLEVIHPPNTIRHTSSVRTSEESLLLGDPNIEESVI